ncbi:MAG: hypothetical protein ACOC80_00740 [Petrotogales bacterium]
MNIEGKISRVSRYGFQIDTKPDWYNWGNKQKQDVKVGQKVSLEYEQSNNRNYIQSIEIQEQEKDTDKIVRQVCIKAVGNMCSIDLKDLEHLGEQVQAVKEIAGELEAWVNGKNDSNRNKRTDIP